MDLNCKIVLRKIIVNEGGGSVDDDDATVEKAVARKLVQTDKKRTAHSLTYHSTSHSNRRLYEADAQYEEPVEFEPVSTSKLLTSHKSLPSLSYASNGLKRNKSNDFKKEHFSSFSLSREGESKHQSNTSLEEESTRNATFEIITENQMTKHPSTHLLSGARSGNTSFGLARNSSSSRSSGNASFGLVRNSNSSGRIESREVFENKKMSHQSTNMFSEAILGNSSFGLARNFDSSRRIENHQVRREESKLFNLDLEEEVQPQIVLVSILRDRGYKAEAKKSFEIKDFFYKFTDEDIAGYDQEVINAIRQQDIPLLKELRKKGKKLQCANRFGESLVHMACRRGFTDVVRFLIEEAGVTLRVKDDYGRTPLHDACWNVSPNFELMSYLLEKEADLLLVEDARGHFPFSYTRRNHWKDWARFLERRREDIHLKTFE